jgi:putative FmdB family regulatory protein
VSPKDDTTAQRDGTNGGQGICAMPIYEYLCPACNRVFNFLAKSPSAPRRPVCPKCGRKDLKRMLSRFSVTGGSRKSAGAQTPEGGDGEALDDPRIEREMMKLMGEAENIDESDPRQLGRLMRRMSEITGEDMGPEMEEAMRRLEAGEDPDKIEEEMGDVLDEAGDDAGGAPPSYDDGLYPM